MYCGLIIISLSLMILEEPVAVWAQEADDVLSKAIPDVLVYTDAEIGGASDTTSAVIVNKARQRIVLYQYDGHWKNVAQWPCSTGKKEGPKKREGDQKTPEGVYFATRDVGQRFLSDTYGSRALPLDYPNWLDRSRHRTGSAIWLHGTNKPLNARDSNGCVVIENAVIDRLARSIRLQRTPVIIVDQTQWWSVKAAQRVADKILSAADQWHDAMMHGSFEAYNRWYAPGNKPPMAWWQRWCRQRNKQKTDPYFVSLMRGRAIFRSGGYYILFFDHHLVSRTKDIWAGRRKLYLTVENDHAVIVGDTFQTSPQVHGDPLFYAWRKLWQNNPQRCNMAATEKGEEKS